jgi:PAP2 superfamily/Glycosyltransferase family 87
MTNADRRGSGDLLRSRTVMVLGLWLLTALLAARQAANVLRLPPDQRFTDLETWIGNNGILHFSGSLYDTKGAFTGTPFAGLVLKPLTRAAEQSLGVFWTFGTLLLVVALGFVVTRALPEHVARRGTMLAAPVVISLLVISLPVRNTFALGQTSILPVLLVLLGCLPAVPRRQAGVLIGLAAALQPPMLLFVPFLWLTGRRPTAVTSAATFAACTALAWATMPGDSATYWVNHVAGAGLGAPADSASNQSLHGLLLRAGLHGPVELMLFGVLAGLVAVVALRRAALYARDGQMLLAAAIVGCAAVAASPVAWQHQLLWILLAAVGRVGRRQTDRPVWPVFVVLVTTFSQDVLLPHMDIVSVIGDNVSLLAALVAACVVPFMVRTDPSWDDPVPTPLAAPAAARYRWIPLLRGLPRPLNRPNLLLELLLIRVGYWAYSFIRGAVPDGRTVPERHGRQVIGLERTLHIDIEHWVNHRVAQVTWLRHSLTFYYETFHFLVPLALLGVLYARRPAAFRTARTWLSLATLLGLVGFWVYPLAPPRLMPGEGFIDTAHPHQDLAHPNFGALTKLSNQYAAMPSLHVGWSLWCALIFAILAPRMWMKALGFLYPLLTTFVIVGSANHYVLDAVGGVVVVTLGLGLQYALTGRTVFSPVVPAAEPAAEPAAGPAAGPAAEPDPIGDPEPAVAPARPALQEHQVTSNSG